MDELARAAFETFSYETGEDGDWDDLTDEEQSAWAEVADAVLCKARRLGLDEKDEDEDY